MNLASSRTRRCVGLPALAVAAALAACASMESRPGAPRAQPSSAASPDERARIDEAEQAIRRDEAELRGPRLEAAPDCARVCQLVDNICALGERICRIAERYPKTDPVAARCTDDRARCVRARDEARPRCACPAP